MSAVGRLLFVVVVIWVAMEAYTGGTDGLLGRLLPGSSSAADEEERVSVRAVRALEGAYDESLSRVDRMLERRK